MAMSDEDRALATEERRYGDDTPPLFSSVRDQPYSNGRITSQARTMSAQYIQFLQRNKETLDGR